MIKITLPDGTIKEFEKEINAYEIAQSISEGLARLCIAAKVDDKLIDLFDPIKKDSKVELITPKSEYSLHILRHTTAHVFAQATLRVFPKAKITIGPATEIGFFYDVDYDELEESDLEKIELEMKKIVKEDISIIKNYKTIKYKTTNTNLYI
jgi:threonyl-tRNA synthetase